MADGTQLNAGTGGDILATDDLATLNGVAVSGVKVQRVKAGFGSDGDFRDVDAANGLPVTGTFWQATQPVSGSVSVSGSVAVAGTFFQATQPVSAAALPLPSGASTEATLATVKTSVDAVKAAIQATVNIAGTVWVDSSTSTPAYYVRRETANESTGAVTVTWFNPDGTSASPTVANLKPISNVKELTTENVVFSATSGGTGYSTGDTLVHAVGIDTATSPVTVAYAFWLNATTGAAIAAPTGGTYVPIIQPVSAASLPLPTGAATEATLAAQSAKLPASVGAKASASSLSTTPATDDYARLPAASCNVLLSAAASTNATSVKASAGALKGIQGYNASASPRFLKFYDKASAPTVGTDTPVKSLYLPPGTAFVFDYPAGFKFATGIAYALTGAAANADTTALVAGDINCLNVDYI